MLLKLLKITWTEKTFYLVDSFDLTRKRYSLLFCKQIPSDVNSTFPSVIFGNCEVSCFRWLIENIVSIQKCIYTFCWHRATITFTWSLVFLSTNCRAAKCASIFTNYFDQLSVFCWTVRSACTKSANWISPAKKTNWSTKCAEWGLAK